MKHIDPIKRFAAKVFIGDECWEWRGGRDVGGYGRFWWNDRTGRAHRYAYELFVGPIPDGMDLDHLCRNRCCVNPAHLEPVTERENALRGNTIVAAFAIATECVNGHPFDSTNTYSRPTGGRGCRECRHEATRRYRRKVA